MTYIAEALRQQVAARADGRCEYCRLPEKYAYFPHEIDHIYAEKHGGDTVEANLCLACADCNRHKGSDLCSLDPLNGAIVALFHPRQHLWNEHYRLLENGLIEPLTANGRVTERVLRFNRTGLVTERARLMALGHYEDA
jgi:hypothetical protein